MKTREQGAAEMRAFLVELETRPGITLESAVGVLDDVRAHLQSLEPSEYVAGHSTALEYAEHMAHGMWERVRNCMYAIEVSDRKLGKYVEEDPRHAALVKHLDSMRKGLSRSLVLSGLLVDTRYRAARKVNGRSR